MEPPYQHLSADHWRPVTEQLIAEYPLSLDTIRDVALETWEMLWTTRIGVGEAAINLSEIDVPAPVVGYFFERLFARALGTRTNGEWRGQSTKDEKDLVYPGNRRFDTEIKSSGQLGTKIFGNRSYGMSNEDSAEADKVEKSGYYITVNFYQRTLNLLRFGWIDFDDWIPQKSAKGQAATLGEDVYKYKLIAIPGEYRANARVGIVRGVGSSALATLHTLGITTVAQLANHGNLETRIRGFAAMQQNAREFLGSRELPPSDPSLL
jgi:hypothetical protein